MKELDSSSVSHQHHAPWLQLSKTANKPKCMFPILRKISALPKRKSSPGWTPIIYSGFWISRAAALLTQGVLSASSHTRTWKASQLLPYSSATNVASLALKANRAISLSDLSDWGNFCIFTGTEGMYTKTEF